MYDFAGKDAALFADSLKIRSMNKLMREANRLKSPTEEFSNMRSALANLSEYHENLAEKYRESGVLDVKDYERYGELLEAVKERTKEYISKKGITPRTGNGRDRLNAALSIQSGAEELLIGFEREMKQEAEKEGHAKTDPEAELS